jgi:ophiobolin F synthase
MTRTGILLRGTSRTGASTWDTCKSLIKPYLTRTNFILLSRLWHGLVTFGCAITIPEEEADEVRELLTPALISAALVNDLFSFEKERNDTNVQNAVLVVMREHGCSEEEARQICRERIRVENAKYVRVVKDTSTRTDLCDDVKRYIEVMQYTLSGNVAWSSQCPRYNERAKWNELQLLRAEYGVEKYPAIWPLKDATDGLSVKTERKEPLVNGNIQANGHKRKRNGNSTGDDIRTNGTNGVKKPAHISPPSSDSLVLADVVSLALDWNLPELSDSVSWTSSLR